MPTGVYKRKVTETSYIDREVFRTECENCGEWHKEGDVECPRCKFQDPEKLMLKNLKEYFKRKNHGDGESKDGV